MPDSRKTITGKDLASVMSISLRTVQRRAKKEHWARFVINRRGDGPYYIDTLPIDVSQLIPPALRQILPTAVALKENQLSQNTPTPTPKKKNFKFRETLLKLRYALPAPIGEHVSQKSVAKAAGFSLGSYQTAEAGTIPGDAVLMKLAKYFNVSEETLLNPPDEQSLIYKDEEERGRESQDKEGLFGKTRHVEVEGTEFAVTTHEPRTHPDPYRQASKDLLEIYNYGDAGIITAIQANLTTFLRTVRRERQVAQQAEEIKELKALCKEMKARITALEAKPAVNDPGKVPTGEHGEKKAM